MGIAQIIHRKLPRMGRYNLTIKKTHPINDLPQFWDENIKKAKEIQEKISGI